MKDELSKVQEQFNWDHAENIRQKQQIEELKKELEGLHSGRRAAESEIAQLKAKNENYRQEIADLRKENMELTKKKEDTKWIAKADYDKLQQALREKEKELERIKRESSK